MFVLDDVPLRALLRLDDVDMGLSTTFMLRGDRPCELELTARGD